MSTALLRCLLLVWLAFGHAACGDSDASADVEVLQAGDSNLEVESGLKAISLTSPGGEQEMGLCSFLSGLGGNGSLIIATLAQPVEIAPQVEPDCDGPYAQTAYILNLNVGAVVAGDDVESSVRVVSLGEHGFGQMLEPGDDVIMAIKRSRGEWFRLGYAFLFDETSMEQGLPYAPLAVPVDIDMPDTFADLHMTSQAWLGDFGVACPDFIETYTRDEQSWEAFFFSNTACLEN